MKNIISVFTPTYNRAYLLKNLFESLKQQTNKNFEWIIVDDDSNDDTENLVKSFIQEQIIEIRYYRQKHGGKHRAINLGMKKATGSLFFIVDSDDILTNDAIEVVCQWSKEIINDDNYCGLSGEKTCAADTKSSANRTYSYIDATSLERDKYKIVGDKAEIFKTEILRKYPFPEFNDEFFVTEAVCWNAMAADGYKIRWYNYPIYICDYLDDGLTKSGANNINGHIKNYEGYLFYIKQSMKIKKTYQFVVDFSDYEKTANQQRLTKKQRCSELGITIYKYLYYKMLARPVLLLVRKIRHA